MLDDVLVGLQRIDVGAECQSGDRIDGIAHQIGLQIDGQAVSRRLLPAVPQATGDPHEHGKVGLDVRRIEACHDHPALTSPCFSIDEKQAGFHAGLPGYFFELGSPPEPIGPISKHRRDRLVVGNYEEAAGPKPHPEIIAI